MRHRKLTVKLGRTSSQREALCRCQCLPFRRIQLFRMLRAGVPVTMDATNVAFLGRIP